MKGWLPEPSSPQSDIDANLPLLRGRSRSAIMNLPLASSAVVTSRTHVIGAGLRLRARIKAKILGLTPEEAAEWERNTEAEFDLFAGSKFCDLHKKNNLYDLQDIAYVGYLANGDSWAALKYRPPLPGMPYSLRIQLFEADRVSNPDSGHRRADAAVGAGQESGQRQPDNKRRGDRRRRRGGGLLDMQSPPLRPDEHDAAAEMGQGRGLRQRNRPAEHIADMPRRGPEQYRAFPICAGAGGAEAGHAVHRGGADRGDSQDISHGVLRAGAGISSGGLPDFR
jgi:hypothetical protein